MAEVGVTKQVLAYSMKNLMTKQPLAKITVGDVCASCGMNRKSFYYHFQDKYDLVAWIFRGELAAESEGARTIGDMLSALCRTLEKNMPFYRAALKETGQNSLREYIADELRPMAEQTLAPHLVGVPHSGKMAELYVDMCCSMVVRWVQGGCAIPSTEFLRLMYDAARLSSKLAEESLPS